jgi:peptidoglycan/xylan/chitin deacetylase (PgdA/CDA1 family)
VSALLHRPLFWRPALHGGLWRLPASLSHLGGKERILLTFDDGPDADTAATARVLEREGARALFFLIGGRLPADPQHASCVSEEEAVAVTQALLRSGHLVGVHGLRHRRLLLAGPQRARRELLEAAARIEAACGLRPRHQRPPYGSWRPGLGALSRRLGLEPVFWSLDPRDYCARRPEEILARVLPLARAGDILLLHSSGPAAALTRAALPAMLDGLRARGLEPLDPLALLEAGDG